MGLLASILRTGKKGVLAPEWVASLDGKITSQIACGFLDEESIVACTSTGNIYAVNSSGNTKWKFSSTKKITKEEEFFMEDGESSRLKSSPVIADIDKNGYGEVIFGSEHGTLYAVDCKGKLLWSFKASDAIGGSACVEDINNDGKLEILFGSSDGRFYALSGSGKLLWRFNANSGIESQPAALSGLKKSKKIVFGTNDGTLHCLNEKGKELWAFRSSDKITTQPSIGNLFSDTRKFIVFGSQDNSIYSLNEEGSLQWAYKTEGKIFSKAALADINNDNRLEVIFGSCDDKLHVLSSTGKKIWDYETNFWVVAPPIVSDFDNDHKLEISIGSYDNSIYILEAEGKYSLDYIPGISGITGQSGHYTDLVTSEPGDYIAKVLSAYKTDGIIVGQAAFESGKSIVAASETGKLYKLKYRGI